MANSKVLFKSIIFRVYVNFPDGLFLFWPKHLCLRIMIRHPKIRVLKQIMAAHRGLVDPTDAGAAADHGAVAGALKHSESSESMALQEVANKDTDWVLICFPTHWYVMSHLCTHGALTSSLLSLVGPFGVDPFQESRSHSIWPIGVWYGGTVIVVFLSMQVCPMSQL